MDVVEAIDLWIDEHIDDLSDDELERVLSILDVVATSPLADEAPDELSDRDVDELAELVGDSDPHRDQARAVLRAALFDEEIEFDAVFADIENDGSPAAGDRSAGPRFYESASVAEGVFSAGSDSDDSVFVADPAEDEPGVRRFDAGFDADDFDEPDDIDDPQGNDDPFDADHDVDVDLDLDLTDDADPDDIADPGRRSDQHGGSDLDEGDLEDDGAAAEVSPGQDHDPATAQVTDVFDERALDEDDFLSDLASAQRTDEVEAVTPTLVLPEWTRQPRAVPLAEFDELGPSFLPEPDAAEPPRRRFRANQVLLPMFMVVGLAVFAWGTLRLIDSLDAEGSAGPDDATTPTAEPTAEPLPSPTVDVEPSPTADAGDDSAADVEGAPAEAATVEQAAAPVEPARLALRLVTGEVLVIDPGANPDDPVAEVQSVVTYEIGDDERPPARDVVWGDFGLAVADDEGSVVVVGPDGGLEPVLVYDGASETGEATELAPLPGAIAVLTDSGNIVVVPSSNAGEANESGGAGGPDVVWDADAAGTPATAITSVGAKIPFALEGGNARMIDTEADNAVITVWLASVLPPVDHVQGAPDAVLLGNGDGAVTRYRLGDLDPEVDGERVQPVWAPEAGGDQAAVSYKSIGERVVIVTVAGSVLLTDGETVEEPLWDPAETETRALYAAGDENAVLLLLETGSVLRVPLDGESPIESLWDVTDSTLAPANQLVVECCTTD